MYDIFSTENASSWTRVKVGLQAEVTSLLVSSHEGSQD